MKNDATFVRMRSSKHLRDGKMLEKATHFVEFHFLTNCSKLKWFSPIERRREDLQKKIDICLGTKL